MTWLFAVLVKSFVVFAFCITLAFAKIACQKLPDCFIKKLLLFRIPFLKD